MRAMKRLSVVGVGPGTSDLLTLRALERVSEAEVLFYPVKREGEKGLAFAAVEPHLPAGIKCVPLLFPMTLEGERLEEAWRDAADAILREPFERAVFVVLGDPTLYSTYFYVHPLLKGVEVELVPGVSSISACCCALGESLAQGDGAVLILSASHSLPEAIDERVSSVVLMKIPGDRGRQRELVKRLREMGFSRIRFASRCMLEGQVVSEFIPEGAPYLSMVIAKR